MGISVGEFRANMKVYLDKIESGESVVVRGLEIGLVGGGVKKKGVVELEKGSEELDQSHRYDKGGNHVNFFKK